MPLSLLLLATLAVFAANASDGTQPPVALDASGQASLASAETVQSAQDADSARAAQIRAEIKAILARSDFAQLRATGQRRPTPRWLEWIREIWDRSLAGLIRSAERVGGAAPWLPYALLLLAALALVLMTWRVVIESFLTHRPGSADRREDARLAPQRLFEMAAGAAGRGDYSSAVRFLFQAAVLSLFGDLAQTTPSYLLLVRLRTMTEAPLDEFARLTSHFDASFYGGAPVSRTDYENAQHDALRLRRASEE
ncbi:MAG: hypothetical protein A2Y63_06515 [Candidatus Riflebacteria bacterium RBG_13_59_9]|nr:MAG: hypothetical protein A2Y63_06515 [Candidatus Riflebacteria bacterium RBG_13_59_9]